MSRKSERLVNLTIALLATGRWITKSEIFRSIEGYAGDISAQERMFERDKEELRNLGIEIEVGSFDPLFEDEVGYRIRPEKYRIDLSRLSSEQISLMSAAAMVWKNSKIDSQASSALLKLSALGIESDIDGINPFTPQVLNPDHNLDAVINAIASRKAISFGYRQADSSIVERAIEPFGVGTKNGYWYVSGRDLDKDALRVFRLDRCVSAMKEQGKANSYELPKDFSMKQQLAARERKYSCVLSIRVDSSFEIRRRSELISSDDEWDQVRYTYASEDDALRDLLWHRGDVRVIEPASLLQRYRESLANIVSAHG
ncbi:unannotated protein [freshwater metagenome]|uniref:Unannotated protein n=1 Tax=freshwater metagenome TaxID=449393 RepID=A0A6J6B041_9ZZZZ|nr:WYL domain-containing protein [Actinomycetota bacterium]